tara:strand:+ start:3665 stop:4231 length:567 start_codon:yes stop_codon:yes gene_type:complete
MRSAIAGQDLVLDDGSGQQVGTYQQGGLFTSGKEVSTSKGQKEEQLKALAKRKKALDAIKGTRKALEKGRFFGEKEDSDLETDLESKDTDTDKKDSKKEDKEKATLKLSKSSDPTSNAFENAMNMAKLTDNPYAQGGAALLGILQAEQTRKQQNRKLDAEAMSARGKGKAEMAAIYQRMAESMKGMLS